jgi:predicted nucleic acid-binding protein/mRNA-degrading endonuclease RelE of RelBE toxin-antitoxin system
MRVILDTNIFISREDNKIVSDPVQKLLGMLNQYKIQILVHPRAKDDIERDKDSERKKILQSKISSYTALDTPPDSTFDGEFQSKCGAPKNDNDKVDNELIYAVYKDAVDFLITEDKGIQQKGRKLDISDRILSIAEGIDFFQRQFEEKEISIPRPLLQIPAFNVNVNDPIFDSLKGDYPEFNQWWGKVCREGRTVIVYKRDNQSLGAIYLQKMEEEAVDSTPPLPKAKRLKICTLKVVDTGYKLGEFFLKKALEFAIKNNTYEIYLTHVTIPNDPLVGLIEEFGFENIASKGNEQIFLKKIFPVQKEMPNTILSKIHFPCLRDGEEVRKFLVPIIPTFHSRLFPEFQKLRTSLFDGSELIPEGNTIKKAYLCNSKINKIRPGDLVLFYLSREEQEITTIGTVESVFRNPKDTNDIIRHVGKRTVYSIQEINGIFSKDSSIVLLFLFHFFFPKPVTLKVLKSKGVLSHAPQSIIELSQSQYMWIKSEGELDERFTFN